MPNRMPDRFARQNVGWDELNAMVGITRSRVFFSMVGVPFLPNTSIARSWDVSVQRWTPSRFRHRPPAWPPWRPGRMPASRWKRKCFRRPWRMPRCADGGCWCWAGFLLDCCHQGSFFSGKTDWMPDKSTSSCWDDLGPKTTWEPQFWWLYGRVSVEVAAWCLRNRNSLSITQPFPSFSSPWNPEKSQPFCWWTPRIPQIVQAKAELSAEAKAKATAKAEAEKVAKATMGRDLVRNGAPTWWKLDESSLKLLGSWCLSCFAVCFLYVFDVELWNYLDVCETCWDLLWLQTVARRQTDLKLWQLRVFQRHTNPQLWQNSNESTINDDLYRFDHNHITLDQFDIQNNVENTW